MASKACHGRKRQICAHMRGVPLVQVDAVAAEEHGGVALVDGIVARAHGGEAPVDADAAPVLVAALVVSAAVPRGADDTARKSVS